VFETVDSGKFETLIEISTLINSNYADGRALLTKILESSARLADAEAASIVLHDPVSGKLRFAIALGPKKDDLAGKEIGPNDGIAGWAFSHGRSLIVNDTSADARFAPEISKTIDFPARSILAVPMKVKDKIVGVIELINKKKLKYFVDEDLGWMEIFAVQAAIAIENARFLEMANSEINYLRGQVQEGKGWHPLVYASHVTQEKIDLIDRIATSDASVLILGESGVGKELFAERLHAKSKRADKPFIRVNCAALPENLLESELFGHVKGAFTDAYQDRKGRFEMADGGTIFLDEIGEFPLRLQAKLLRVLQQKTFEKVGSSTTIQVDVRIVTATNRDMEKLVEKQEFRSDLYYRLNVLPIYIPPLRERKDDIPALASHFLSKFSRETNKRIGSFSNAAMDIMLSYSWPGNVRELENAVERAVVMANSEVIGTRDLMLGSKSMSIDEYEGKNLKDAVTIFKKHCIKKALEMNSWNQTLTAKELKIQRTYLSRLIKELSIVQQKE
jgi:Nif-specific regulatory protein